MSMIFFSCKMQGAGYSSLLAFCLFLPLSLSLQENNPSRITQIPLCDVCIFCTCRKQGMDGQLYCEGHAPAPAPVSPPSGPVSPTTPTDGKPRVRIFSLFLQSAILAFSSTSRLMDKSEFPANSKSYGNHMEICHALICMLNSKFALLKDFHLVLLLGLSGRHLYMFLLDLVIPMSAVSARGTCSRTSTRFFAFVRKWKSSQTNKSYTIFLSRDGKLRNINRVKSVNWVADLFSPASAVVIFVVELSCCDIPQWWPSDTCKGVAQRAKVPFHGEADNPRVET